MMRFLLFLSLFSLHTSWKLSSLPSTKKFESSSSSLYVKRILATGVALAFGLNTIVPIQPTLADARLNAPTAAGTRVNSDPESLLRYGLPFQNKDVRDIQDSIESTKLNLKTRRIQFAKGDMSNAKGLLTRYADKIIKSAPSNHQGKMKDAIEKLQNDFPVFEKAASAESDSGSGSVQERKALDDSFAAQDLIARDLTTLEELLVPDDFRRSVPAEYANLPQLQGRAEVAVTFKKADNSQFNVDGKLYDQIDMKLVLDGYNAPITAGNIVDLITHNFYDKKAVSNIIVVLL